MNIASDIAKQGRHIATHSSLGIEKCYFGVVSPRSGDVSLGLLRIDLQTLIIFFVAYRNRHDILLESSLI